MKSVVFVEKQLKSCQFYPQYTSASVPGESIDFFLFHYFSHQEMKMVLSTCFPAYTWEIWNFKKKNAPGIGFLVVLSL